VPATSPGVKRLKRESKGGSKVVSKDEETPKKEDSKQDKNQEKSPPQQTEKKESETNSPSPSAPKKIKKTSEKKSPKSGLSESAVTTATTPATAISASENDTSPQKSTVVIKVPIFRVVLEDGTTIPVPYNPDLKLQSLFNELASKPEFPSKFIIKDITTNAEISWNSETTIRDISVKKILICKV